MTEAAFTLRPARQRDRRHLLRSAVAAAGAAVLSGCDRLSNNDSFVGVMKSAEHLNRTAQKLVAPRPAMAQEFDASHVAKSFRSNGTLAPTDADYKSLQWRGFADFRLGVGGLVESPATTRWRNCAPCRRARRSRVTIVSRAGVASANGKACR